MKYKVKVIYTTNEAAEFPLAEYDDANKTYENICMLICENATSLNREWTIQMLMENNSVYKELILISKRHLYNKNDK